MNVLGIDIGTTSVKVSIYDAINDVISDVFTCDTEATIICEEKYFHEQDVNKILLTINKTLGLLDQVLLQKVGHVAISGQMHGIMFWNESALSENNHSNFITWMDQRCTLNNFIDSLPQMPSNIVEDMAISSGYGCATLFHLMHSDSKFVEKWKYAGNIVDFFVCTLCGTNEPLMSPHMAHSWGYFDIIGSKWFNNLLDQHHFPTRLLPRVVPPGTVVGLCKGFTKVPIGALVYVGMGDLQCGMYGALSKNLNSAINISTSAQFAVRVTLPDLQNLNYFRFQNLKLPPGLVINPNFDDNDYLLVAASLNGGNVLESFVTMLQQWFTDFSGVNIAKETIWCNLTSTYQNQVSDSGSENSNTSLRSMIMNPILFGERYCPNEGASIMDIFPFNCSLDNVYKSLCFGLINNLTKLLPLEIISKLLVNHLKCSGGAIKRHKCLEDSIKQIYAPVIRTVEFTNSYDACVGAIEYVNGVINKM